VKHPKPVDAHADQKNNKVPIDLGSQFFMAYQSAHGEALDRCPYISLTSHLGGLVSLCNAHSELRQ
jgi:hypothetical protein